MTDASVNNDTVPAQRTITITDPLGRHGAGSVRVYNLSRGLHRRKE